MTKKKTKNRVLVKNVRCTKSASYILESDKKMKTFAVFEAFACDSEYNVTKLESPIFRGTIHSEYTNQARTYASYCLFRPDYLLLVVEVTPDNAGQIDTLIPDQKLAWEDMPK